MELAHRASRYGVWFGGGLIFLAAFIVGFEVLIRKVFNMSIGGADELSGFALAIGSAWAFGFALLERAHIRIDSAYVWLPLPVRAIMDVIGLTVFVAFFGLITIRGWSVFTETVRLDAHTMSPLGTPLIYPQAIWIAGMGFLMVIAILLLADVLLHLVKGDLIGIQRRAGSKTANEELEEELRLEKELRHGAPDEALAEENN